MASTTDPLGNPAHRSLRTSEIRYRRLFEAARDGIFLLNADTAQIEDVNPYLIEMLGFSHEEFLGKKLWEVGPFADIAQSKEMFAQLQSKGYVRYEDLPLKTTTGAPLEVEFVSNTYDCEGIKVIQCNIREISERKKTERELLERYRAVVTSAPNAFVTSDAAGRIVDWNLSAELIFGYAKTEVIGQPLTLLIPQRFQKRHLDGLKRVQSGGERRAVGKTVELAGRRKDASEFPMELSLAEWTLGAHRFFNGIIRDITERKVADAKIQRQAHLYAALSQCNKAILHCASEEELFPQICRAAVDYGGMEMAWIGVIDTETSTVRPVASYGVGADEIENIKASISADSPRGRGPTGTAIRENRPFWCQDFANEPATAPWRALGARAGWIASASLPLHRNGVVIGAFTLHSGEANCFDESACDLLIEMATDLSFALDNFVRESQRRRGEEELRAAEERFRGLVEQSIAGIYIIQDGKLVYANPRLAEIFGYESVDAIIGRDPLSLVTEKDRAIAAENLRRPIESKVQNIAYSFTALRKDGTAIEIGLHGASATHCGRPAVIGVMQDISEKKRAEEEILRYIEQLKTALMSTVEVATTISEMRDPYTAGHERRVAGIAVAIGAELGLDASRQEGLRVAGDLHDVGKITIPAEILSKPGKLNAAEMELVRGHSQASYDVLKGVEFPWPVAQVALQHHERMDGSGYPQGLKGDAILLEARIMAVADVVEAMSSHRPYRPGLGIDKALAEIERGRGTAYDPLVVDACMKLFKEKGYALPA